MRVHRLEIEQTFRRPLAEVFAFFSDAANLDQITPPWLHFRILTTASPIQLGARIDYRLRLHGIPIAWRTEITAWEPPHRFVDEQRRGPYRQWVHEHCFEDRSGSTWMRDRVDYAVPGGCFEPLLHRWFVKPDVRAIFDYRQRKLAELYGPSISS